MERRCAATLFCLVLCLVSQSAFSAESEYPTVMKYLEASKSSAFISLVKALKLEDVIESGSYTIFLPTDKAFSNFFTYLNIPTNGSTFDATYILDTFPVLDLVRYHFSPQALSAEALPHGQRVQTFLKSQTQADKLRITVDKKVLPNKVVLRGWESWATVQTPDIQAGKSVIHVVDTVLRPKMFRDPGFYPKDLIDMMIYHRLSYFQAAVGLVGQDFWDSLKNQATPVTLAIPTDDAFMATLQKLGSTLDELNAANKLLPLLQYHIADGYGPAARMVEGGSITTWKKGSSWIFSHDKTSGEVIVTGETNKANVLVADSFTGLQGHVVHVIDAVLIPKKL